MCTGVLVNNAGQGGSPALVHEMISTEVDNIVAINCAAMVKATHGVLPSMLARGKGAIVNVSSVAGSTSALPCMSVYAASKAFVQHFSKSLAEEYVSRGIDIQVTLSTPSCPPSILHVHIANLTQKRTQASFCTVFRPVFCPYHVLLRHVLHSLSTSSSRAHCCGAEQASKSPV